LFRVTDSGELAVPTLWLLKFKPVGDRVALAPEVKPMPLNESRCGLPAVSSVTSIEALRGPGWLGVNVTVIEHFAPAARLNPHVLLWLKSPLVDTPLITTGELPLFVRVAACLALAVPTS
jgi:hypothetical protein